MDSAGLLIYIFIQGITPGPSNFMSFYTSATYGLKGALRFLSGTITGFTAKMLLCGLLNLLLAATVPQLIPYLKWVGAAYLLYLAVHIVYAGWKEERAKKAAAQQGVQQEEQLAPPQKGVSATFLGGILLQVLNIKSWLLCLTIFSVYIMPYTMQMGVLLLWSLISVAIMVFSTMVWALGGQAIKTVYAKYRLWFDLLMAAVILYCAVKAVL